MKRVLTLGPHEWPTERPFTHPGLAGRDCEILTGLITDLAAARNEEPQLKKPVRGRDRLIVTASGREHAGGPVAIVGFFGEKNPGGGSQIAEDVESVNTEMVENFDAFPLLLGYVSRMLDDGYNYANLVVLDGADGIEKWREIPVHAMAATDLAPRFYTSVRIYNGALPEGLGRPDLLRMSVVKFWDYGGRRTWHAVRRLD